MPVLAGCIDNTAHGGTTTPCIVFVALDLKA
jgi:hypothetical protein